MNLNGGIMEKFEWERVNKRQYDTTDRMHVGNGYIYKVW